MDNSQFDLQVRAVVYDRVLQTGEMITTSLLADQLGQPLDSIQNALQRLADAHMLVLQRGNHEILMANPFSAVPTGFLVNSAGKSYFGNCIWDAMGISAMLNQDAVIEASCSCCGTKMTLGLQANRLQEAQGVVHFTVPTARWWENIVYT